MDSKAALVRELVERIATAQRAFVEGRSQPYEELFEHSDEATLTGPFGGPTIVGWKAIQPRMRRAAAFFAAPAEGSSVQVEAATVAGELVLLRLTERNRVRFNNRDDVADWDLRVTLVLRRTGGGWRILHRHADPLVELDTSRRLR